MQFNQSRVPDTSQQISARVSATADGNRNIVTENFVLKPLNENKMISPRYHQVLAPMTYRNGDQHDMFVKDINNTVQYYSTRNRTIDHSSQFASPLNSTETSIADSFQV